MPTTTPRLAILVDTATGWGRRLIRGVLDFASEHGACDIQIDPKGRSELVDVPEKLNVDGIIARVTSKRLAQKLKALKKPVVNVSGLVVEGGDFPRVTTDYDASARLAEAHFRDRAFRNFGYVGPLHLAYVREHEQSFEKAVAASGAVCHVYRPGRAASLKGFWHPNEQPLVSWLKALPKPVGIFTWGFEIGRDIINACRAAALLVPYDVAVLGGDYDDLLSDASHPALSGVVTPSAQIGYQAASMLHSMMNGGKPPTEPVLIPPREIEERLSTDSLAIDDPKLLEALLYLREHACDAIQVGDILRKVPMARRSLERRFLRLIGRSPAEEMRRLRINHARKLLAQTNLPMQDIAEACGYATYNYLGVVFKKETGISPGRYRNQARRHTLTD